ncbi:MAG: hypothetical protein JXP73_06730 [Deltaproteobacteria bacterium]|nr:hypothetical protein [Deltaproteobacteria bacterium]
MSTLSPKGQALIRAAQRAYQPTAADRERLLGQLRAQLGDAALPPDMATAASAATASSSAWPLISVVVVGVGILGGALFYAWPRGAGQDKMQETKAAPVAARTQAIEPIAAPPVEPPTGTPTAMPTPDPPALPATTAYRPKDRLAAEVAILSRATRDLRAGRPAEALKALDEYRRRFPKGLLGEEHRAARAQALCALGRFDEANAKLAELPPQSPLAVRARQFCKARWAAR